MSNLRLWLLYTILRTI